MSDEEGGGGGHGAVWLVSYADMVTLIMAFFIVMYTMSQVDAEKFRKLAQSMHTAFAPLGSDNGLMGGRKYQPGSASLVIGGNVTPARATAINPHAKKKDPKGQSQATRDLSSVVDSVAKLARDLKLTKQVHTKMTERGAVISLEETASSTGGLVPFESGSAALNEPFKRLLDQLAPILAQSTSKIEVQGHTDRRPIRTAAYPSNWELSAARAGSVVRYLSATHAIAPRQFVCAGFADTLPANSLDTPEGWARNRRIEIVVTRQPVDEYDKSSRADSISNPKDITAPVGLNLVPTRLPNDPASRERDNQDQGKASGGASSGEPAASR